MWNVFFFPFYFIISTLCENWDSWICLVTLLVTVGAKGLIGPSDLRLPPLMAIPDCSQGSRQKRDVLENYRLILGSEILRECGLSVQVLQVPFSKTDKCSLWLLKLWVKYADRPGQSLYYIWINFRTKIVESENLNDLQIYYRTGHQFKKKIIGYINFCKVHCFSDFEKCTRIIWRVCYNADCQAPPSVTDLVGLRLICISEVFSGDLEAAGLGPHFECLWWRPLIYRQNPCFRNENNMLLIGSFAIC